MKIPQAQADALGGCQECQPGKVPDPPKPGQDAPLPSVLVADPSKPDWIGLQLADRDGAPVAGERFVVTPSDGSPIRGTLDKQGRIRIEGVSPGSYSVTFPERDAKEWKKS